MKFTYPKYDKIPKTHVDWLVPMDDLWVQCTWVSLTGLTEKVKVGQIDLTQTQNRHNLLLLSIRFKIKVHGFLKFEETVTQV